MDQQLPTEHKTPEQISKFELHVIHLLIILLIICGLNAIYIMISRLFLGIPGLIVDFDVICLFLGYGILHRQNICRKLTIVYLLFAILSSMFSIYTTSISNWPTAFFFGYPMASENAVILTGMLTVVMLVFVLFLFKKSITEHYFINQRFDSNLLVLIAALLLGAMLLISIVYFFVDPPFPQH